MRATARLRTRRSYVIEAVCYTVVWVMNLAEMATRFRAMGLMEGLTAGMIFWIAPVGAWQAFSNLLSEPGSRESRDE